MKQNQQVRKKLRRQAQIIVGLIIAVVVCFIALTGFILFELLINSRVSNTVEQTQTSLQSVPDSTESSLLEKDQVSEISENADKSEAPNGTEFTEETKETQVEVIWPTASVPSHLDGPDLTEYVVVIDPGHQEIPNTEQEPLAPWMSGSKDKSSQGATGIVTYRAEHDVNLAIGLLLSDYLEALGCEVYMTRTTSDVDLSNIERADFAKSVDPDVFIRLYCGFHDDASEQGIRIFVADSGPYSGRLCGWADILGESLSELTGSEYLGCDASSRYTGLNWSRDIPAFMLQMGYMSNPYEDRVLSDPEYQLKICQAIADFVAQMPS